MAKSSGKTWRLPFPSHPLVLAGRVRPPAPVLSGAGPGPDLDLALRVAGLDPARIAALADARAADPRRKRYPDARPLSSAPRRKAAP